MAGSERDGPAAAVVAKRGQFGAEVMATIEHLHDHPDDSSRGLYVLDCDAFADIVPALSDLPGEFFVALLIADFSAVSREVLVDLSRELIAAGARYFCAWGRDCQVAHLAFDLACCEFETDSEAVILTTDHSRESVEAAIWFATVCAYPVDPYDRGWHATVAICVSDRAASQTVRKACTDPIAFSESHGPAIKD